MVEEYDSATDTWTEEADMPTARFGLTTSVANGRIYAIGGASGYDALSTVEEYDPATDTWKTVSEMLEGRFGLRASVVDGKIYAIGGVRYWGSTPSGKVEEYDPLKDLTRLVENVYVSKGFVVAGQ